MQDSSSPQPDSASFGSPVTAPLSPAPDAPPQPLPSDPRWPGLASALRSLLSAPAGSAEAKDSLLCVTHELQASHSELELQNRMQRDVQSKLEEALHRYAELYDSLPIGLVTLTTEGGIMEANQTVADMVHHERTALPRKFLREFLPHKDGPAFSEHLRACIDGDGRHTLEVTLMPPGGTPFFVQLSSQRASIEGRPVIRTAITDISRLKDTQHSLEELVTEQESFAYSISHDLRSPLLTISNFASLLTDEGVDLDPAEQREILGRIQRAATRLDRLLLTLLDYTRVSRHPMPLEPVSVEEIVHDLLLEHATTIHARRAQLSVQSPLPRVVGSRTLLNQALDNLLSNALKYTPSERVPVVHVTWERRDRAIVLTVADEGIGIAVQHHEKIFRIFERLHSHAAYPGTGIGLALVRRAAERMHGRVWVESEEGKGSRFCLELPCADAT